VKLFQFLLVLLIVYGCNRKSNSIINKAYNLQDTWDYSQVYLAANSTYYNYHLTYDIATPRIETGEYEIDGDSITFNPNKDNFLDKNIIIEKNGSDEALFVEPYDIFKRIENRFLLTQLVVKSFDGDTTMVLGVKNYADEFDQPIKINKRNLENVNKLLITDRMADHTFEIAYSDSISHIKTPSLIYYKSYYKYKPSQYLIEVKGKNILILKRNESASRYEAIE
jgi:hypothetical protein